MRECFDGTALVDEEGEPLGNEELEEFARSITTFESPSYTAQAAHLYYTPAELKDLRITQKVFCGRYGHQPITIWEHRPVSDLVDFSRALSKLLAKESPDTRANEDG